MIEEVLAEAKRGKVIAVAIAVCYPDGVATGMAGSRAPELNLAMDELKHKLLTHVMESNPIQ